MAQPIVTVSISEVLIERLDVIDGKLGYSEDNRAALRALLEERFGKPELKALVVEFVVFAFFLEQKKSAFEAAQQLIDLVQLARPSLEAQGILLEKVIGSSEVEDRIKTMLDRDRDLTPVGNKPAVDGAMKWWDLRSKR